MQNVLSFDDVAGTITVEGGATYTAINDYLKDKQWAVKNLATLPHFTVVPRAVIITLHSDAIQHAPATLTRVPRALHRVRCAPGWVDQYGHARLQRGGCGRPGEAREPGLAGLWPRAVSSFSCTPAYF